MKANHFNIGFTATQLICDFKHKDSVSSSDILNCRQDIYEFITGYCYKIFKHFPLELAIIWNMNVFDPTKMIPEPEDLNSEIL